MIFGLLFSDWIDATDPKPAKENICLKHLFENNFEIEVLSQVTLLFNSVDKSGITIVTFIKIDTKG